MNYAGKIYNHIAGIGYVFIPVMIPGFPIIFNNVPGVYQRGVIPAKILFGNVCLIDAKRYADLLIHKLHGTLAVKYNGPVPGFTFKQGRPNLKVLAGFGKYPVKQFNVCL